MSVDVREMSFEPPTKFAKTWKAISTVLFAAITGGGILSYLSADEVTTLTKIVTQGGVGFLFIAGAGAALLKLSHDHYHKNDNSPKGPMIPTSGLVGAVALAFLLCSRIGPVSAAPVMPPRVTDSTDPPRLVAPRVVDTEDLRRARPARPPRVIDSHDCRQPAPLACFPRRQQAPQQPQTDPAVLELLRQISAQNQQIISLLMQQHQQPAPAPQLYYMQVPGGPNFAPMPGNPPNFIAQPGNPPNFVPGPGNPPNFTPQPGNPPNVVPAPGNPPNFVPGLPGAGPNFAPGLPGGQQQAPQAQPSPQFPSPGSPPPSVPVPPPPSGPAAPRGASPSTSAPPVGYQRYVRYVR